MTEIAYATSDQLKLALAGRQTGSTTVLAMTSADDELLDIALLAASRSIDNFCGRVFYSDPAPVTRVVETAGRLLYRRGRGTLLLTDDIADETITVSSGETALTSIEAYPSGAIARGLPATGILLTSGTWSYDADITARWGAPEVPSVVTQACLLQAGRLYRRKDSPEGMAGSPDWGLVRVPNMDPDVRALLAPLKLPGFG